MERSDQERPPRDAVDILLAIAQRLEREGDLQGAMNSCQLALTHLSQDDRRRADVQARIGELDRRAYGEQPPDVPHAATHGPQTSPESMPSSPVHTGPTPTVDRPQAPSASWRPASGSRSTERYQRAIGPISSWLFVGCAVLLGLTLLVLVGLAFFQSGFASLPDLQARVSGQAPAAPASVVTPQAQRAPTAAAGSSATVKPASSAPPSASAKQATVVFDDSFGRATMDGSKWIVDNATNTTIDLSHGTLRLASTTSRFPYIHSRINPFPAAGDFRVTVRFQYLGAGTCGVPMAMASFVLPAGLSRSDTDRLSTGAERTGILLWFGRNAASYRAGSVREDISLNPLTGRHVATVDYIGGIYELAIDNTPIYTSGQSNVRPAVIWFGSPFDLGPGNNCDWDTLEISEVRVENLK